jgi:hypothetical protein
MGDSNFSMVSAECRGAVSAARTIAPISGSSIKPQAQRKSLLDERIAHTKVLKINISWSQSVLPAIRRVCTKLGFPHFGLNCTNRQ